MKTKVNNLILSSKSVNNFGFEALKGMISKSKKSFDKQKASPPGFKSYQSNFNNSK